MGFKMFFSSHDWRSFHSAKLKTSKENKGFVHKILEFYESFVLEETLTTNLWQRRAAALPKHFSANYPQQNPNAQSWAPHFCREQQGSPDKTSVNLLWGRNLLSHPSSDPDLAATLLTSAQEVTSAKWVWNRKLV